MAAAEVPAAFARLKKLSKQEGDLKVAVTANREIIALGTDRSVLDEDKMQTLQARKLEAEIKVLEQRATAGDPSGRAPLLPGTPDHDAMLLREWGFERTGASGVMKADANESEGAADVPADPDPSNH